jgi:hypothetical protein
MAGLLAVGQAAVRSAVPARPLGDRLPAIHWLFLAALRAIGPPLPIQTGIRKKASVPAHDQHRHEVPHGRIVARPLQPILKSVEA